jgi:hypothetical protein
MAIGTVVNLNVLWFIAEESENVSASWIPFWTGKSACGEGTKHQNDSSPPNSYSSSYSLWEIPDLVESDDEDESTEVPKHENDQVVPTPK